MHNSQGHEEIVGHVVQVSLDADDQAHGDVADNGEDEDREQTQRSHVVVLGERPCGRTAAADRPRTRAAGV